MPQTPHYQTPINLLPMLLEYRSGSMPTNDQLLETIGAFTAGNTAQTHDNMTGKFIHPHNQKLWDSICTLGELIGIMITTKNKHHNLQNLMWHVNTNQHMDRVVTEPGNENIDANRNELLGDRKMLPMYLWVLATDVAVRDGLYELSIIMNDIFRGLDYVDVGTTTKKMEKSSEDIDVDVPNISKAVDGLSGNHNDPHNHDVPRENFIITTPRESSLTLQPNLPVTTISIVNSTFEISQSSSYPKKSNVGVSVNHRESKILQKSHNFQTKSLPRNASRSSDISPIVEYICKSESLNDRHLDETGSLKSSDIDTNEANRNFLDHSFSDCSTGRLPVKLDKHTIENSIYSSIVTKR